ncbi:unnamed protein product [Nippostrongylus brasiliensis]|uniref:Probable glutathione reductase 2 (inferred by orthology to a C. elegans protein) n=1 Tax=Nippostrongylus brasiliensis TaxID=27835 RepID=A0A0N4XGZ9_NIPBR|nr:unnamed protein product [Nippostrongylus brasiliensis]
MQNWVKQVQREESEPQTLVCKSTGLALRHTTAVGCGCYLEAPSQLLERDGITSDDLFSLSKPPGKTLVVGASYVALECAGFLAELGFTVDLLIRSKPLKSFDQDCVKLVMENLKNHVNILYAKEVNELQREMDKTKSLEQVDFNVRNYPLNNAASAPKTETIDQPPNKSTCSIVIQLSKKDRTPKRNGQVLLDSQFRGGRRAFSISRVKFSDSSTDVYDTVVWAMGRDPQNDNLNLAGAVVETDRSSGRIVVAEDDRTSAQDVYAIGDIALGRPELTPTAIRAGQLLAQRLFGGGSQLMTYDTVPTTVFTPLELGTIGLTEERASEQFGVDAIEVYHSHFTPFEYVIPQDPSAAQCYAKVICLRSAPRKVLGMHLVGPNAAEIIQGYAVAMKVGVTFDQLTAINPGPGTLT